MSKKFKILHHIDQNTINEMFDHYAPVFVLTTGRAGSKFIHHIFNHFKELKAYHEAFPTLQYFSNFAYHNQHNPEVLSAMFQGARMELILDAFNQNKIFVESNQCLAFYAPAIIKTFPNSRFIHLIRHPGDFIRSAIMKGWHINDSIWESGRLKMKNHDEWNKLCHIEKLAWVWKATNEFIINFLGEVDNNQFMTVKFEDLINNKEITIRILEFIGLCADVNIENIYYENKTKINKLVIHPNEPKNMQKVANYPFYNDWNDEEKNYLSRLAQELANYYSYEL